jgi:hypothetical protein
MTLRAPPLAEPPLSEIGVPRFVEQLHVIDVADDVRQLGFSESGPVDSPLPHRLDHPGSVVPEQARKLLQAAAGANEREVGTERAPVSPNGMAVLTPPLDKDPPPGRGIAREGLRRLRPTGRDIHLAADDEDSQRPEPPRLHKV